MPNIVKADISFQKAGTVQKSHFSFFFENFNVSKVSPFNVFDILQKRPFGDFEMFSKKKRKMRFLNSLMVPKNVKEWTNT